MLAHPGITLMHGRSKGCRPVNFSGFLQIP